MGIGGRRSGFALAVAIFAIVVIGTLIAGVFFASTQEYRISRNALQQSRALAAAELGLNAAFSDWQLARENALPIGASRFASYDAGSGATASVRITRLSLLMFFVVSDGNTGSASPLFARRRVSALLRANVPEMNFLAALTTRGATQINGSTLIDGNDHDVPGWPCPPLGPGKPALTMADTGQISFFGCTSQACLAGNPKLAQNAAASDTTTYFVHGSSNYAALTAMASKVYPSETGTIGGIGPSSTGGRCDTESESNWGDVNRAGTPGPCEAYLPIIWVQGSGSTVKVTGGSGQGILLVDGNLEIAGGFDFRGPVIVRGHLKFTGAGGSLTGGVMVATMDPGQTSELSNAVIQYSSCALSTALAGSSLPKPVKERSWAELYQ